MSETVLVEKEFQNAIHIKPANTFGHPVYIYIYIYIFNDSSNSVEIFSNYTDMRISGYSDTCVKIIPDLDIYSRRIFPNPSVRKMIFHVLHACELSISRSHLLNKP